MGIEASTMKADGRDSLPVYCEAEEGDLGGSYNPEHVQSLSNEVWRRRYADVAQDLKSTCEDLREEVRLAQVQVTATSAVVKTAAPRCHGLAEDSEYLVAKACKLRAIDLRHKVAGCAEVLAQCDAGIDHAHHEFEMAAQQTAAAEGVFSSMAGIVQELAQRDTQMCRGEGQDLQADEEWHLSICEVERKLRAGHRELECERELMHRVHTDREHAVVELRQAYGDALDLHVAEYAEAVAQRDAELACARVEARREQEEAQRLAEANAAWQRRLIEAEVRGAADRELVAKAKADGEWTVARLCKAHADELSRRILEVERQRVASERECRVRLAGAEVRGAADRALAAKAQADAESAMARLSGKIEAYIDALAQRDRALGQEEELAQHDRHEPEQQWKQRLAIAEGDLTFTCEQVAQQLAFAADGHAGDDPPALRGGEEADQHTLADQAWLQRVDDVAEGLTVACSEIQREWERAARAHGGDRAARPGPEGDGAADEPGAEGVRARPAVEPSRGVDAEHHPPGADDALRRRVAQLEGEVAAARAHARQEQECARSAEAGLEHVIVELREAHASELGCHSTDCAVATAGSGSELQERYRAEGEMVAAELRESYIDKLGYLSCRHAEDLMEAREQWQEAQCRHEALEHHHAEAREAWQHVLARVVQDLKKEGHAMMVAAGSEQPERAAGQVSAEHSPAKMCQRRTREIGLRVLQCADTLALHDQDAKHAPGRRWHAERAPAEAADVWQRRLAGAMDELGAARRELNEEREYIAEARALARSGEGPDQSEMMAARQCDAAAGGVPQGAAQQGGVPAGPHDGADGTWQRIFSMFATDRAGAQRRAGDRWSPVPSDATTQHQEGMARLLDGSPRLLCVDGRPEHGALGEGHLPADTGGGPPAQALDGSLPLPPLEGWELITRARADGEHSRVALEVCRSELAAEIRRTEELHAQLARAETATRAAAGSPDPSAFEETATMAASPGDAGESAQLVQEMEEQRAEFEVSSARHLAESEEQWLARVACLEAQISALQQEVKDEKSAAARTEVHSANTGFVHPVATVSGPVPVPTGSVSVSGDWYQQRNSERVLKVARPTTGPHVQRALDLLEEHAKMCASGTRPSPPHPFMNSDASMRGYPRQVKERSNTFLNRGRRADVLFSRGDRCVTEVKIIPRHTLMSTSP